MNQELVEYIKQQTSLNVSKNKITDVLLGQGWQQAELDEAFAAAESAGKEVNNIDYEAADTEAANDFGGENEGGSKKKLLMIVGITLVLVLAVAGILAFKSGDNKSNTETAVTETETTQSSEEVQPASPAETEETAETLKKPAVDNTILITAAEKLSKTITPPVGWELRQGIVHDRPLVAYFKPANEGAGDKAFAEYISITAESLGAAGIASEADYMTKSKSDLAKSMQNYKVTNEKPVTLSDGTAATLIGASSTKDGNAVRSIQLFAFKDGAVYVITGVVPGADWDAEKDMLGAAILSFKFPEL